jgi:hypothetical protein
MRYALWAMHYCTMYYALSTCILCTTNTSNYELSLNYEALNCEVRNTKIGHWPLFRVSCAVCDPRAAPPGEYGLGTSKVVEMGT